jgi:hypothetical protein
LLRPEASTDDALILAPDLEAQLAFEKNLEPATS